MTIPDKSYINFIHLLFSHPREILREKWTENAQERSDTLTTFA